MHERLACARLLHGVATDLERQQRRERRLPAAHRTDHRLESGVEQRRVQPVVLHVHVGSERDLGQGLALAAPQRAQALKGRPVRQPCGLEGLVDLLRTELLAAARAYARRGAET